MAFHGLGVCSNGAAETGADTPADPLGLLGGCTEPALVRAPSEDLAAGTNSGAFLLRPRADAVAVSGKPNGGGDTVSLTAGLRAAAPRLLTAPGSWLLLNPSSKLIGTSGVVSLWLPRDEADALRLIAAELFALVAAFLSPKRVLRSANFWSSAALEDGASGGDATGLSFIVVTGTRAGAGKASGEAAAPLLEPGPDELPAAPAGAKFDVNWGFVFCGRKG